MFPSHSKSHGYGTSRQLGAGLTTPPPRKRVAYSLGPGGKPRFRLEDVRQPLLIDHDQLDARVPGPAAIDAAVQRYIRGSSTRGIRKTSMAISSLPKMTSQSGGFVVKHRECLGVVTSSGFTGYRAIATIGAAGNMDTTGLRLYPTNADAFPWLSTIATRFEQYRWRKVNIQFITASSDGTTADLAQGNVMAYIEYNPTTALKPLLSRDFLNNYGACAVKPSQSFQMGVEARGNPFELKWTATAGVQDPRFSADASLYMATEGVATTQAIGYLYVDYEIELHKPQV